MMLRIAFTLLTALAWPVSSLTGQDGARDLPVLLLDAGHGGSDQGYYRPGGPVEKDVTLVTALGIRQVLDSSGSIAVSLSREEDSANPRGRLLQIARELGADYVITIHASAGIARGRHSVQLYYGVPPGSLRLAERLARAVFEVSHRQADIRPAPDDWFFLNEQLCPAVWLSVGWFEDVGDERLLVDQAYHAQLGRAVQSAVTQVPPPGD